MSIGTLYGVGVGPGDPELITLKGQQILDRARYVFAPKARNKSDSIALDIARKYINRFATVEEILFPMVTDRDALDGHWQAAAETVLAVLRAGKDAVFLTLGDALLYSTYIYLIRAIKRALPALKVVTVPGVTAFSAAAALTGMPVGEGKHPVVIIPTADDLTAIDRAFELGGTVVLMKVGRRLSRIIALLEERHLIDRSVFVARAGLAGECIETVLTHLNTTDSHTGYLSTIIIDARKEADR